MEDKKINYLCVADEIDGLLPLLRLTVTIVDVIANEDALEREGIEIFPSCRETLLKDLSSGLYWITEAMRATSEGRINIMWPPEAK